MDNLPPEEKNKIGSMLRENDSSSTSWMYEQPKKAAEDFLLGKVVKSLDELAEISRDQAEETPAQRLARLDMQAKFREDPLNLMRQHEFDKRNALLQNTAKMKKLKRLIEQQNHQHEKKLKENRKKHRHSKKPVSSSSSDSEDDDGILDKFIRIIQQSEQPMSSQDPACDAIESTDNASVKTRKHKHHKSRIHHRSKSRSPSVKKRKRRSPSPRSKPASVESPRLTPLGTQPIRYGPDDSRFITRHSKDPPQPPRRSKEEMAVLRDQMAADAKARELERSQRFESHKLAKSRQETEELENKKKFGASFLKGMTLSHVTSTSVEESIQRKANSRQRGDMNDNFLSK